MFFACYVKHLVKFVLMSAILLCALTKLKSGHPNKTQHNDCDPSYRRGVNVVRLLRDQTEGNTMIQSVAADTGES